MNTTEPHDDLDARLTAALHRRAADVHLAPRGLGDVRRRVHRRRRRAATVGAAAVALPALAGIGWLAARPATPGTTPAAGPSGPVADAPSTSDADQAGRRCTGQTGAEEQDASFSACEPVGVPGGATVSTVIGTGIGVGTTPLDGTTTTLPVPTATWPPLTTIATGWVGTILIVDATGEADVPALSPVDSLESTLWAPSYLVSVLVADRTSPETMVMPVATDDDSQANASILAAYLGVGGFDTWSAIDWTADAVPDDIAFVVVLGQDWREHPSLDGAVLPPSVTTTIPGTAIPETTVAGLAVTTTDLP